MTNTLLYKLPVIVLMTGFLFSCKNEIKEINALHDESNLPVQVSHDATYNYTEDGELKNKLMATKLERYINEDPRLEATGGFTMVIFDSLQQEEARLTADRGIFRETENVLEAHYNVILTNINGDSLETEELIWLQDSGKVYTEKEVVISSVDGKLYGKGLVSDETFTKYTINDIHGSFNVEDAPSDSTPIVE